MTPNEFTSLLVGMVRKYPHGATRIDMQSIYEAWWSLYMSSFDSPELEQMQLRPFPNSVFTGPNLPMTGDVTVELYIGEPLYEVSPV